MKHLKLLSLFIVCLIFSSGCVSQKKYAALNAKLDACESKLNDSKQRIGILNKEVKEGESRQANIRSSKDEVIAELRTQIDDLKKQREQQFTQVDDLTVLSKSANENIGQTLKQLEKKDGYIKYLLAAKSKADSLNLALSLNLKSVLKDGIEDEDVEVKVDKTVVFINLSDKMLFKSGSDKLTPRASEVLAKIAKIVQSKPELEVMVEGHTDNVPISNRCIEDNWDLSVKRAASVVRTLQNDFNVDPGKLIAAGRSEYVELADNSTPEGRSTNRRTRIILLPKLGQFYDLLKPSEAE
ncbi:MAG: OmpA family protein [Bacteroidota bacterium]